MDRAQSGNRRTRSNRPIPRIAIALTVTLLAGLFAAATLMVRAAKRCYPETCGYEIGSLMRDVIARQEIHRAQHGEYALSLDELGIAQPADVTIELLQAADDAWIARGRHDAFEGSCVAWAGAVSSPPSTDYGRVADQPTALYCDFPS
jgi:hypothetical protein